MLWDIHFDTVLYTVYIITRIMYTIDVHTIIYRITAKANFVSTELGIGVMQV